MGDALKAIQLEPGLEIGSMSCGGGGHCCAVLKPSGAVKCWGSNSNGELGLEDRMNRGDKPNQMGTSLPYVNLGKGVRAKQVSTYGGVSCAVTEDGKVKCW